MFSVGNKIEYECKAGYKSNSTFPLTATCLENGTWSFSGFECLPGWFIVIDYYFLYFYAKVYPGKFNIVVALQDNIWFKLFVIILYISFYH